MITKPSTNRVRVHTAAVLAGASLLVSACGASDSSVDASAQGGAITAPAEEANTGTANESAEDAANGATPPSDSTANPAPDESTADAPAASSDAALDPALNQLADVDVVDIATGEMVNIKALATGEKPLVLWFWAPH